MRLKDLPFLNSFWFEGNPVSLNSNYLSIVSSFFKDGVRLFDGKNN
jgi:hypothetical protein